MKQKLKDIRKKLNQIIGMNMAVILLVLIILAVVYISFKSSQHITACLY